MSCLVVIPTVTGREDHLARCIAAYHATAPTCELYVVRDFPTCGEVWNLGAAAAISAHYDYLHLTADDLVPHPGWYEVAVETTDRDGASPSALIYGPDGSVESHGDWGRSFPDGVPVGMTRIPFLRTEWWQPIPDTHNWSDNSVSSVLRSRRVPIIARTGYAFSHHWAQVARQPGYGTRWNAERAAWEEFDRNLRTSNGWKVEA